jgi:hypothetical protein
MSSILGIDPGKATGWSVWEYTDATAPQHIDHGIIEGGVEGFIQWWRGASFKFDLDKVVCESFRLDGRTARPDITPLRIEGALAVLRPDTIYQQNVMKAHMPDAKIKELGLWWPGRGHDRDSLRHVFAWLKTHDHRPTLELWRPVNKGLQ